MAYKALGRKKKKKKLTKEDRKMKWERQGEIVRGRREKLIVSECALGGLVFPANGRIIG